MLVRKFTKYFASKNVSLFSTENPLTPIIRKEDPGLSSQVFNGNQLAKRLKGNLKMYLQDQSIVINEKPGLAFVTVGIMPNVQSYIKQLTDTCKDIGINCFVHEFPSTISKDHARKEIETLNTSEIVHGIILGLPLPQHLKSDMNDLLNTVEPEKDIDAMTDTNLLSLRKESSTPFFISSTALAIMRILDENKIRLANKKCVIFNKGSRSVGLPLESLLSQRGAIVTICDNKSNIEEELKKADIVCTALGMTNYIKPHWIKPGSVLIDIGTNFVEIEGKSRIIGDLPFNEIKHKARLITPTPGGVGPITTIMLAQNVITAWSRKLNIRFLPV